MWSNKKHGKTKYRGMYQRHNGERVFVLLGFKSSGEAHVVTFESWQMAKLVGWSKV